MTVLQIRDVDKENNKFEKKTQTKKQISSFLWQVKYKFKNLFKDCLLFSSMGYYQYFKSIPQKHKTYLFR